MVNECYSNWSTNSCTSVTLPLRLWKWSSWLLPRLWSLRAPYVFTRMNAFFFFPPLSLSAYLLFILYSFFFIFFFYFRWLPPNVFRGWLLVEYWCVLRWYCYLRSLATRLALLSFDRAQMDSWEVSNCNLFSFLSFSFFIFFYISFFFNCSNLYLRYSFNSKTTDTIPDRYTVKTQTGIIQIKRGAKQFVAMEFDFRDEKGTVVKQLKYEYSPNQRKQVRLFAVIFSFIPAHVLIL
jgi:hypothetical protein